MCRDNVLQREGLVDARLKSSAYQMIDDILLRLCKCHWIAHEFEKHISLDGQLLTKTGKKRVWRRFRSKRAIFENDAAWRRGARKRLKTLAGDRIKNDPSTLVASNLLYASHQVFLFGDDDMVGAQGK